VVERKSRTNELVDSSPVRILYIGGTGRTGSTLLANILGQYDTFFSGGELAFLWRFGLMDNGRCACGLELRQCPTWVAIFDQAFGGVNNVDASEMVRLRKRFNSHHLPLMVTKGIRKRLLDRTGDLPLRLAQLYSGIRSSTGRPIIVDSSKEPHYSYILRSQPSLEVYFLHLVRDPRAVAYSWRRRKVEAGFSDGRFMATRRPSVSSTYFDVSNIASELIWARHTQRYMRMRYEDFISAPAEMLRRIGEFVEVDIDPSQAIDDGFANLSGTHSAWGNPNRFLHGQIGLAPEDEWKFRMPQSQRAVVTAMTLPLILQYAYPVRS